MAGRSLLLFVLAATAVLVTGNLQGVGAEQLEVPSLHEAPTESQCRPYIEKALKQLGTGETTPGAETEESPGSPPSPDEQLPTDEPGDEESEAAVSKESQEMSGGDQDQSIEDVSAEQTGGEAISVEEDASIEQGSIQSQEAGGESQETLEAATSEEDIAGSREERDVSAEESAPISVEATAGEEEAAASAEEAAISAEAAASAEEAAAKEAAASTEEAVNSAEEAAASSEEAAASVEKVDTSAEEAATSAEEAAASNEETIASVEEAAASAEVAASPEEAAASTEEAAASAEEASMEEATAASPKEAAASAEEAEEDIAGSREERDVSAEESAPISVEVAAGGEEAAASAEEAATSAEEAAAASAEEEAATSTEEAAAASAEEEAATSVEEAADSAEQEAASAEEAAVSAEQEAASAEEAAVSAEEAAAVSTEAAASAEEAAAASAEEQAASAEEAADNAEEEADSAEEAAAISTEAAASAEEASAASAEEAAASTEAAAASAEEAATSAEAAAASAEEAAASPEEAATSAEETAAASAEEAAASTEASTEAAAPASTEEATSVEEPAAGPEAATSAEEIATEGAPDEAEAAATPEPTPEEDLTLEVIIPENLRPRDHIEQILRLDSESAERELLLGKTVDVTLKELKRLYDNAIKPLEVLYKYRDLSNRHFGDSEIFSKPLILFMGPWSGGKSSIINYLLDNEFKQTALRTGAEPSPAYFNILMWGDREEVIDGTQLAADWTFSGLQKFGQGLLDRLRGLRLPNRLLEKVNIVEIPGILEIRKQVERLFPFNDACQWFIDRADIIFLVYDPAKLDVGPETEAILDQLKGREYQTRIILNKADQVRPEELMRVQGTLIWNISPLMSSSEPPVMYSTSLWSLPYEAGAPIRLLLAQERAFLRDMRDAIDKRVENKIASARRFAVRVRNHAKMVDCYLTTYYNHKGIFGNRKKVSDDIIERPQDYHIYEGLSTLTNISRYDLPDPDVYRDFFRLNPLYDFQQLSATCTYFRGCPINRLDVAIAYDLPELVGKYKKSVDEALASQQPSKS